jgi:hypothetical protein
VCICSNLTVAQVAGTIDSISEGESPRPSVPALLDPGAVVGAADRPGHAQPGYRLSAKPLVEHARLHGVEVDLVAFFRRNLRAASLSPANGELVQTLWNKTHREEQDHGVHARRMRRTAQSRL